MVSILLPLTALNLSAFVIFALSSFSTYRELLGRAPADNTGKLLKIAAGLLLSASLWLCVASKSWGLGLLLWFGNMTMTALLVALLLTLKDELKRKKPKRR
ncbi:DUF3325 domain-containing protein [Shewanella submarina]|uniref:DUF3325 domain-containing protein n=1 Tax=Shewanella submarina TaxID=2016376 RepID=A0ABV7GB73_9GAMM|nr:DUF3325 domain-containing protein [Shewanella submarina]MCL1037888.1 DUF3325 domain-containing protein [Shewanella submarina]